jgi:hypothetical protein
MLAKAELPFEAAPLVALAYQTASRIDSGTVIIEGFSPLANSMMKQIIALREWIKPPDVIEEDPFDALTRHLGTTLTSGGDDAGE